MQADIAAPVGVYVSLNIAAGTCAGVYVWLPAAATGTNRADDLQSIVEALARRTRNSHVRVTAVTRSVICARVS